MDQAASDPHPPVFRWRNGLLSISLPASERIRLGRITFRLLAGCWRRQRETITLPPADLRRGMAHLQDLVIAHLALPALPPEAVPPDILAAARDLRRIHIIRSAIHETEIAAAFRLLLEEGVDTMLVKGRSTAAYYADPALRPSGDMDLWVRPSHRPQMLHLLHAGRIPWVVDLEHIEAQEVDESAWDVLAHRSQTLVLEGVPVPVLGRDDHLRLLLLHWLRHNARRPLWLVDIAALLEAEGPPPNWEIVLRGSPAQQHNMRLALGLVTRLLGARHDLPGSSAPAPIPPWLERHVLREAARSHWPSIPPDPAPRQILTRPDITVRALLHRWPAPVEACALSDAPLPPHLPVAVQTALFSRQMLELAHQMRNRISTARAGTPAM